MAPKNKQLSAAEKAEIMGEGFSLAHQQEAQERYGNTADWAEYQRRTATMNSADWQNGKQQAEEVEQALVEAFTRGVKPGSEEANALAERHRASLFFFEVTPAKHAILARGYVADPRFKAHYKSLRPGWPSGCERSSTRTLEHTAWTPRTQPGVKPSGKRCPVARRRQPGIKIRPDPPIRGIPGVPRCVGRRY